jgi:hypothetical protein
LKDPGAVLRLGRRVDETMKNLLLKPVRRVTFHNGAEAVKARAQNSA